MRPLGGPSIEKALAGRVRAEQIDAIVHATPQMMIGNVLTAAVLVAVLYNTDEFWSGLAWGCCVVAIAGFGYWRWLDRQQRPRRTSVSERAIRIVTGNAAILAGVWAIAPILFIANTASTRLVVACLVAGMMSGGFALATVPSAMIVFEAIFVLGSMIGLARHGKMIDLEVGILLCVYSYVLVRTAVTHAIRFVEDVVRRIEGERQRDLISLLLRDFETNASDWLWEIDEDYRVSHASTRLLSMLGRDVDEVSGAVWRQAITPGANLLPHSARVAHAELARLLLDRRPIRDHVVMVHIQDEPRWWSLSAKPIFDESGAFRGYRGFGTDITAARRAEERVAHMSRFDTLTGLPNRRRMLEETEKALSHLVARGQSFAFLTVDVDRFKLVNDLFGRRNGDDVMKEIAERLSTCLRDGDVLGRIGGDLFGIIRIGVSTPEDLVFLSKRLNESMAPPFMINGLIAQCTITTGITIATPDMEDAEVILDAAEQALEAAKARGFGSYHFFEAEIDLRARENARFEAELRTAVARKEIEVAWRPVVDLRTRKPVGCSASLRWRHPSLAILPEDEFLPAAASAGLAGLIGVSKLREVCARAVRFPDGIMASVALTQHELEDAGTVLMLARALESTKLSPGRLEIRAPAPLLLGVDETCMSALTAIAQLGIRIAAIVEDIEEAGRDYPDELNVARVVLSSAGIDTLETAEFTVKSKRAIVASGLATDHDVAQALSAGCALGEGSAFGPMLGSEEIDATLDRDGGSARAA